MSLSEPSRDPKLTPAQWEYLHHLERWGPGPADPSYAPAMALLKRGYASREIRRNKMRLHIFTITEAGRQALLARPVQPEDER